MNASQPTLDELERTVERMEGRFGACEDAQTRALFTAYLALKPRFAADLADQRDLALANASALMLIKQMTID